MINSSQHQNPGFRDTVTVIHKGMGPDDTLKVTAENHYEAIHKLLQARGLKEIAELLPAVIETKWC